MAAAVAVAEFQRAQSLLNTHREASIHLFHSIVKRDIEENDEEAVKVKEQSILELGSLLEKTGQAAELGGLLKYVSRLKQLAWSDLFLDMEAATGQEVELCLEYIEWAKSEKITFLRQALETRLVSLYQEPLYLGSQLLWELKKMEDKALLLLESKTTMATLDMHSCIIHAAEEKDWKTAYSYLYEAFEDYDSIDSPKTIKSLKNMLLCKIMLNTPEDVQALMSGKLALRYAGKQTEALKYFEKALTDYWAELQDDPIISTHLAVLYDILLEQNLIQVIETFSRVQIEHISSLIKLSKPDVERKLSQTILDKKFHWILDQGNKTYEAALETIQNMNKVVDSLYNKAKKLT
uniref:PCI domain-containing protein n=1 Tax=Cebus imitator TaxID=2715852 RepID=A0A2K5QJV6_CEBIM